MRLGIDARAAAEVPAGRGRYVRELLRALSALGGDDRYLLYARRTEELGLDERFEWRLIDAPDPLWHVQAARAANDETDVFLSTNSYLTAWFTRVPTAVVVHDLAAFIRGAAAQKRAARIERATIRPGLRRAVRMICVSQATRSDLVARFPRFADRAQAIPLAADARFGAERDLDDVRRRLQLERPFVLSVGSLEPRKNLVRLIDAWAEIDTDAELLLVGPQGWEMDELLTRAGTERVRMTGYVADEDLAALYQLCTVFAYPSIYEGFGLPVLEALQSGAPVITSDVSSLPEVVGDAAVLVTPHDVGAIRDALTRLLADPAERGRLATAGRERARAFSWERTALETRDLLRTLTRP